MCLNIDWSLRTDRSRCRRCALGLLPFDNECFRTFSFRCGLLENSCLRRPFADLAPDRFLNGPECASRDASTVGFASSEISIIFFANRLPLVSAETTDGFMRVLPSTAPFRRCFRRDFTFDKRWSGREKGVRVLDKRRSEDFADYGNSTPGTFGLENRKIYSLRK